MFLTARDAVEDRVTGLTVGGDDYVTKPFALAELVARVHAILRRTGSEPEDEGILRFADIEMDENTHEVTRAGQPIALTATEFNLLRFFLLNPRHVLSKSQILDHVWHYDFGGDGNVVETYISYLRKKLEAVGPPVIHTVRLVGYALREPAMELSDVPSIPTADCHRGHRPGGLGDRRRGHLLVTPILPLPAHRPAARSGSPGRLDAAS